MCTKQKRTHRHASARAASLGPPRPPFPGIPPAPRERAPGRAPQAKPRASPGRASLHERPGLDPPGGRPERDPASPPCRQPILAHPGGAAPGGRARRVRPPRCGGAVRPPPRRPGATSEPRRQVPDPGRPTRARARRHPAGALDHPPHAGGREHHKSSPPSTKYFIPVPRGLMFRPPPPRPRAPEVRESKASPAAAPLPPLRSAAPDPSGVSLGETRPPPQPGGGGGRESR